MEIQKNQALIPLSKTHKNLFISEHIRKTCSDIGIDHNITLSDTKINTAIISGNKNDIDRCLKKLVVDWNKNLINSIQDILNDDPTKYSRSFNMFEKERVNETKVILRW